jgi:hypothetical protein
MRGTLILSICVVLCGAMAAKARSLPVSVSAGDIRVGATRTVVDANYDEVDFFLTGMTGPAAGSGINILQGTWTAGATGDFWLYSGASWPTRTTNAYWQLPFYSTVNFASVLTGTGTSRGPEISGNLYNHFACTWYTTDANSNVTFPANPVYTGAGTDSTYLAALYVTHNTPDAGIDCAGQMGFTYGSGTVENVHFFTTPEPGTVILLLAGVAALAAYGWRKRK